MELYIIRHAEARPAGENGVNADAERPLTDKGHEQSYALAATLRQQGVKLERLLTSPYLRARQTAQDVVNRWDGSPPMVEVWDELMPESKPGKTARRLRKLTQSAVALVGHMPDLATLAAWLIGSKKARLDFDKGGVALIVCDGPPRKGTGELRWLVTPQWFVAAPSSVRSQ